MYTTTKGDNTLMTWPSICRFSLRRKGYSSNTKANISFLHQNKELLEFKNKNTAGGKEQKKKKNQNTLEFFSSEEIIFFFSLMHRTGRRVLA